MGRLIVPCRDPRVGGCLGHALTDEAVAGCIAARDLDAGGIGSSGHGPRVVRASDSYAVMDVPRPCLKRRIRESVCD